MEPMELTVRLALTGTIGDLRCGLTLDEAQDLLGPYDDLMGKAVPGGGSRGCTSGTTSRCSSATAW